ncbi:hypothetical protein EJ06DRAFT_37147 [Trichodelitschia bisporula]|uniref:Uncharacterized protein n=1 Tax=Trichodelitschia bisporula TaxID=703511 RepID=A0A6G1HVJ0_9PEZI|nr:hypothetical protein EJ06DRAFT_37147 [Trichodelitschia bisporula]
MEPHFRSNDVQALTQPTELIKSDLPGDWIEDVPGIRSQYGYNNDDNDPSWTCCNCTAGPMSTYAYAACPRCKHEQCSDCKLDS